MRSIKILKIKPNKNKPFLRNPCCLDYMASVVHKHKKKHVSNDRTP